MRVDPLKPPRAPAPVAFVAVVWLGVIVVAVVGLGSLFMGGQWLTCSLSCPAGFEVEFTACRCLP